MKRQADLGIDLEFDRNGLEVLTSDVCLELLGSVPIGRIGLCVNALPVVLPVNFVVAQQSDESEPIIVIRCAAGSKLSVAYDHAVVAFEADSYDRLSHSGWSVLVQGISRVMDDEEREWASSLPLQPWAIVGAPMFIGLDTDVVGGRRFGVDPPGPD